MCTLNLNKELQDKINTYDKVWAIQNLQSNYYHLKVIANYIINNNNFDCDHTSL